MDAGGGEFIGNLIAGNLKIALQSTGVGKLYSGRSR